MEDSAQGVAWLLQAARAGSSESLGRALEACRGYLLNVAGQEIPPPLQAKASPSDLVQETFLEAQRDFERFQGSTEGELLAWLRKLLLNNLGDFNRRYRGTAKREAGREVALEPDSSSGGARGLVADVPPPSGPLQRQEQDQLLHRALDHLPDDYRQVLLLRYREEQPFEEIARRLGRSPNAVRKLWARALERLEREMEAGP